MTRLRVADTFRGLEELVFAAVAVALPLLMVGTLAG